MNKLLFFFDFTILLLFFDQLFKYTIRIFKCKEIYLTDCKFFLLYFSNKL